MAKTPAEGKKVLIRRLPPGMIEDEFWAILGDDWNTGNGKVDWTCYEDGEISNELVVFFDRLSSHIANTSSPNVALRTYLDRRAAICISSTSPTSLSCQTEFSN